MVSGPRSPGPFEGVEEDLHPLQDVGEGTPAQRPTRRPAAPENQAAGFTQTYQDQMPRLTRFVMRLGADPHTAADAAHSAFATAYPQWEKINNPGAWLRTVASRTYYRHHLCPETPVESLPDLPLLTDDPAELSEQTHTVYTALAALPERPRQVMAWHLDGYPTTEIAQQLNLTPATVRQHLHRARERLKQLLGLTPGDQKGGPTR